MALKTPGKSNCVLINMTFEFKRFDIYYADGGYEERPSSDGACVLAEDAINREAVNADKIRTLEARLRESEIRRVDLAKDANLYHVLKISDRFEVLTDVYNDDPENYFKSRVSGDGIDYAIQMALDNPRAP